MVKELAMTGKADTLKQQTLLTRGAEDHGTIAQKRVELKKFTPTGALGLQKGKYRPRSQGEKKG